MQSIFLVRRNGWLRRFALAMTRIGRGIWLLRAQSRRRKQMPRSPQIKNAFALHVAAVPSKWQPARANARSRFGPTFAGIQIVWLTRK
jgi:hypothetical protein